MADGCNGKIIISRKELDQKYQHLLSCIEKYGKVSVAFSGGVDSTFLLKAATDMFGSQVHAFFARSLLQNKRVEGRVRESCLSFNVNLHVVDFDPLSWPDFVVNNEQRCYHCKTKIYEMFASLCGPAYCLLDGTNADDVKKDRPGLRAIDELGVKTPLLEAGLTKKEVRFLSKDLGLTSWDLPSESCLATRIVCGVPVRQDFLRIVEATERLLLEEGIHGCRVKLDPPKAYLVLPREDIVRFAESPLLEGVVAFLGKNNFTKVFLELSA